MVGEDELLQRRFHEGAMIGDLAKEIERPPSVIRKRLHSFGLNEGKSERDRSWRSWTEAEQKELLHQYTTGYRLEEIARLHKRSIAAIIVRLKRLGVET